MSEAVARALPLETASKASGLAWRLIAPHLYRQERVLRNLALAYPELPEAERKRLAARMWENLGRTFGELFHLEKIASEGRVTFEFEAQLDEITGSGPCVVCGLHLGNWELVAYAGNAWARRSPASFSGSSNPYVDAETHKMRAFLYEGGLLPKTPVTARRLLKAAKTGGYPAFLADLRDDRGAAVPFFGHPARSNVFPALLARTTGLPLYAGAAFACRTCVSASGRSASRSPDRRPRGRRGRGDGGAAGPVRGLHPRGARAMDVGPSQVGLGRRTGVAVDRKGRRLASPRASSRAELPLRSGLPAALATSIIWRQDGPSGEKKPCRSRRPRARG